MRDVAGTDARLVAAVRPTSPWLLLLLFAAAGGLVYLLLSGYHSLLPALSIDGPITVGMLGIIDAYVAWVTRGRLAGRPGTRPIEPITVARLAALGKASALVGAPIAGVAAGLLGRVLQLDSVVAHGDVRAGAAGIAAGAVLAAAGMALETVCRVKQPPPSDEP